MKVVKVLAGTLAALVIGAGAFYVAVNYLGFKSAPPPLTVRPFGDNKAWLVTEDMEYVIGDTNEKIVVPKGFVTDFASIPQALWSFGLTPHGQHSRAAVVHDYLYWAQPCTREQADRLMVVAMKESQVRALDEWAIYQGVAKFGSAAWQENQRERAAGLPKVVPAALSRPKDPNMGWKAYRALLAQQGVRDPAFESQPSYCRYGDSTEVPTSGADGRARQAVPAPIVEQ